MHLGAVRCSWLHSINEIIASNFPTLIVKIVGISIENVNCSSCFDKVIVLWAKTECNTGQHTSLWFRSETTSCQNLSRPPFNVIFAKRTVVGLLNILFSASALWFTPATVHVGRPWSARVFRMNPLADHPWQSPVGHFHSEPPFMTNFNLASSKSVKMIEFIAALSWIESEYSRDLTTQRSARSICYGFTAWIVHFRNGEP
jgi:hypothetical protein